MLPGGAMDGLDGSGGGALGDGGGSGAAPTIGDMGADSNDGTTDGCQCGNYSEAMDGGCKPCMPNDLAIPDPDPEPPPGPQFKALGAPGNDPGEEDSPEDEETEYQGIIYQNAF